MESNGISEENVLKALRRVPPDRWHDVLKYLSTLETLEPGRSMPAVQNAWDLAHSEMVGIWKDRTDIGSSQEYARQLRHQAENH